MQCACAILSSVPCPPLHYFPTLSHKRHDFRKKNIIEHKICVLIFSTTFVWNISHFTNNWARYDQKMYIGLHVKYPILLSDCNEIWILSEYFLKILKYQISWKSVQWEPSCSMRTDGPTGTTKLIVVLRDFSKAHFNFNCSAKLYFDTQHLSYFHQ